MRRVAVSNSSLRCCVRKNKDGAGAPAKTDFPSAASRMSCLNQAYATPEGKAVQFLSPISLTPLNPNWHENLAEWGLAIIGKGGGMVGSGLSAAVLEKGGLESAYSIGTPTQVHNVVAPIERAPRSSSAYGTRRASTSKPGRSCTVLPPPHHSRFSENNYLPVFS